VQEFEIEEVKGWGLLGFVRAFVGSVWSAVG